MQGEAGAGALKGVLFTVLLFLSLSAEKMFWEICVQVEYRSEGAVMWKRWDEGLLVTSPYRRTLGTGRAGASHCSAPPPHFLIGAKRKPCEKSTFQSSYGERVLTSEYIVPSHAWHPDVLRRSQTRAPPTVHSIQTALQGQWRFQKSRWLCP